jgi:TetR/AcrR family transcriptional regulator, cholesterol catabolism regulator
MTAFHADHSIAAPSPLRSVSTHSPAMTERHAARLVVHVEGLAELLAALHALGSPTSEIRGDTRERILAAAIRLFAIHGFDACTVKQIATEVGIKAPGLYAHFPSKEAVLAAAMSRELYNFLAFVLEPDDGTNPRYRLEAVIRRHVTYQLANLPATTSNDMLLNSEAVRTALGEQDYLLFRRAQRAYVDHVEQLIVDCRVSAAVCQPRVAALAVLSLCDRVNSWYRPGGRLTSTQVIDEYCRLASHMLGLS